MAIGSDLGKTKMKISSILTSEMMIQIRNHIKLLYSNCFIQQSNNNNNNLSNFNLFYYFFFFIFVIDGDDSVHLWITIIIACLLQLLQ